jgi:DedD protein
VESRIKERLTGALILVAALVILVPEIFSGRRASENATGAPAAAPASEGAPLRSYTSDLDSTAPAPAQAVEQVPPDRAPVDPPPDRTPAATMPAESSPPPSPPEVATAQPPPPAPDVAGGRWFVQVGSFSQAANAQRYARQLRDQGHAVIVLPPSGTKSLSRVRVGPVRTREAAGELLTRLRAGGHNGAVVGP